MELKKECMKLGLKQIPVFKETNSELYMGAEYEFKELCNVITEVKPLYVIKVNERKITLLLEHFVTLTNNKEIKQDVISAIIRHELRHIYQQENGWHIGRKVGDSKAEVDADKWMIKSATSKKEKILAKYLKTVIHEKKNSKRLEKALQKAYRQYK